MSKKLVTVKNGNVEWKVNELPFKTKAEFVKMYSNKLKYKINLEDAWNELKGYIKIEVKAKKYSSE